MFVQYPRRLKALNLIILIIHIIVFYDQNISLIFLFERWIPCQALTSVLCLHYRPETVHCSTKDAYTSEITFFALHLWPERKNVKDNVILKKNVQTFLLIYKFVTWHRRKSMGRVLLCCFLISLNPVNFLKEFSL